MAKSGPWNTPFPKTVRRPFSLSHHAVHRPKHLLRDRVVVVVVATAVVEVDEMRILHQAVEDQMGRHVTAVHRISHQVIRVDQPMSLPEATHQIRLLKYSMPTATARSTVRNCEMLLAH